MAQALVKVSGPTGDREVPLASKAVTIGRRPRREYVLRYLQEHPPPGHHDEPGGRT